MFSERRLIKFQITGSPDDGTGDEPEDDYPKAFIVYDGHYATQCKTAFEALTVAGYRAGDKNADENPQVRRVKEDLQLSDPESVLDKNIVIIQGNTASAVLQVIKGVSTAAIEDYIGRRFLQYEEGEINPLVTLGHIHPDHIDFQLSHSKRKLKELFSEIDTNLKPKFVDETEENGAYISIKFKGKEFYIIFDVHDYYQYVLYSSCNTSDDDIQIGDPFDSVYELEVILSET